MDAAVANQFLTATVSILRDFFGVDTLSSSPPHAVQGEQALYDISVLLGLSGDLGGTVVFSCSKKTALQIARSMLGNPDYPEFDELCLSALAELGNMIAGASATQLANQGHVFSVSPPSVVRAASGTMSFSVPVLIRVPLQTSAGELAVCLGLKRSAGEGS